MKLEVSYPWFQSTLRTYHNHNSVIWTQKYTEIKGTRESRHKPCWHGELVIDKEARIHSGWKSIHQMLGDLDNLMHESGPFSSQTQNSTWIRDFHVGLGSVKFWKKTQAVSMWVLDLVIFFWISSSKSNKKKNKQDSSKVKRFCHIEWNHRKAKRRLLEREKVFSKGTSHEGLVPQIYKEFSQFTYLKSPV